MISKVEAIQKLRKMGLQIAEDNSMITVLLPKEVSFSVGLKDVKEKLRQIEYDASFCVKYGNVTDKELSQNPDMGEEAQEEELQTEAEVSQDLEEAEAFDEDDTPEMMENLDRMDDLLSLDEDGQFSLSSFGVDF